MQNPRIAEILLDEVAIASAIIYLPVTQKVGFTLSSWGFHTFENSLYNIADINKGYLLCRKAYGNVDVLLDTLR